VDELTDLAYLNIGINNFDQGEISLSIGSLKNLTYMYLSGAARTIPDSISDLVLLVMLD
jgi:hypothetical protein